MSGGAERDGWNTAPCTAAGGVASSTRIDSQVTCRTRASHSSGGDGWRRSSHSAGGGVGAGASGGAGTLDHFSEVFTSGRADAALAASIFHYAETSVETLKRHLKQRGIPVRL